MRPCGRPAQGRFCSQCGAPLDVKGSPAVAVSDVNEGWKVAIADVVTGERDGVLSVAMSFARTPVDTILLSRRIPVTQAIGDF